MASTPWESIPIEVRLAIPHMSKELQAEVAAKYGLSASYMDRIGRFWRGFLSDLPEILTVAGQTYAGSLDDVVEFEAQEKAALPEAVEEPQEAVPPVERDFADDYWTDEYWKRWNTGNDYYLEERKVEEAPTPAPTPVKKIYVPKYPPSPTRRYDDWTEIGASDAIVIADSELPDYDNQLMRAAHAMGMKHGIKRLIIGGDFWSFDSITPWPELVKERGNGHLGDDLQMARDVLEVSFTWFDEVHAVMGNHEHRVNRLLDGQLGPWQLFTLPSGNQVKVNIYTYMYMNTCRNRIMVVHPKNYSKKQLTIPSALINIERERCDILSTHTHHCCTGFDESGQYQMSEIGCMRDPMRTKYKSLGKTRHPQWVQGFAMVKNGIQSIYPKYATDWEDELGLEMKTEIFGEGPVVFPNGRAEILRV